MVLYALLRLIFIVVVSLSTTMSDPFALFTLNKSVSSGKYESDLEARSSHFFKSLKEGEWYRFKKTAILHPIQSFDVDGREMDQFLESLVVPKGTDFNIVEISNNRLQALIAFNLQEGRSSGNLPSEAYIDLNDIANTHLAQLTFEDEVLDEDIAEIIGVHYVKRSDYQIKRKKRRGRNRMTFCMGDVRVRAHKLCGVTMGKVSPARRGYRYYLKSGKWKKVKYKQRNKRCTVCFWTGGRQDCGPRGCGHASINIGAGRWKGDGTFRNWRPRPVNRSGLHRGVKRRPFQFIGCLRAQPGDKENRLAKNSYLN